MLLNVQGTLVSASIMSKIKDMYNNFSQGDYPVYTSLGNFNTHTDANEKIRSLREGFQVPPGVGVPGNTSSAVAGAGASGPAYTVDKCVPFDPETQMGSDGVIRLDDGKPQTIQSIIDARTEVKALWNTTHQGKITLSSVERNFVYVVAALVGLAAIFAIFSFKSPMTGGLVSRDSDWFMNLVGYTLFPIGTFIAGFLVGYNTFPASCAPSPI